MAELAMLRSMVADLQFLIRLFQEIVYRLQEFLLGDLGSSPLFFLLLGVGYTLDLGRRERKYTSRLLFKTRNHSIVSKIRKFITIAAVYLLLFFLYSPTVANIVISVPVVFYSIYNLRVSSDWHFIYFLSPVCISLILFPNTTVQYLATSYSLIEELDQGETIALIAAFFAFVGWRETSMKGEYTREDALRNRSDEIELHHEPSDIFDNYFDSIEYKAEIASIRVTKSQKLTHRFFRYFFLTKFHGKTRVTLSFEQEINPNLLSVIDSPYLRDLPIENIFRENPRNYVIVTESTAVNQVEGEIHEIFETICRYAHSERNLEVGEYAYPDIFYHFPKSMINSYLCEDEIRFMRLFPMRQMINIRINRNRALGMSSGIGTIPPLTYRFANTNSEFYRTLQHLIFVNLPWILVKKRMRKKYSRLDESELLMEHHSRTKNRPLYEGLYILIDAYQDHKIVKTHGESSMSNIDCVFIKIRSDRRDENWSRIDIPICNFHPDKFAALEIIQGEQLFCDLEEELDAKYVVRNREHFYTIYGLNQDDWIIAKWLEFNEEPGELGSPQKAEFSRLVSLVGTSLDGVIWKRDD